MWRWGLGLFGEVMQPVKDIGCSFKGLGLNSQHPHGSSQISVIPIHRVIDAGRTPMYIKYKLVLYLKKKKKEKGKYCQAVVPFNPSFWEAEAGNSL